MAEMGLFELGDMWKYSRTLGFKQRGKGRDKIEIRKDLQVVSKSQIFIFLYNVFTANGY